MWQEASRRNRVAGYSTLGQLLCCLCRQCSVSLEPRALAYFSISHNNGVASYWPLSGGLGIIAKSKSKSSAPRAQNFNVEQVVTSPKHNLRNLNKMSIYESISLHIIGFSQMKLKQMYRLEFLN